VLTHAVMFQVMVLMFPNMGISLQLMVFIYPHQFVGRALFLLNLFNNRLYNVVYDRLMFFLQNTECEWHCLCSLFVLICRVVCMLLQNQLRTVSVVTYGLLYCCVLSHSFCYFFS